VQPSMTVAQIDTPELYHVMELLRDKQAITKESKPKQVYNLVGATKSDLNISDLPTFRAYWYKVRDNGLFEGKSRTFGGSAVISGSPSPTAGVAGLPHAEGRLDYGKIFAASDFVASRGNIDDDDDEGPSMAAGDTRALQDNRMTPAKRRKLMSVAGAPKERSWKPIGWMKVIETTKLALIVEYTCNLPSGCNPKNIKIAVAGTKLKIEVYMPDMMYRGDILYRSFKKTAPAEFHNREKVHSKICEEDLGADDFDPDVKWPATIDLPHPVLNNKILRKEITNGGKTGTAVLSIDLLLENPREKAVEFECNTIDDL